jgi:hypothetical protein
MKALLLTVTVTATALTLAATSLAVGDAKNESPFTQSLAVVQSSKALLTGNEARDMRSEALNMRYHLGAYAATGSASNYQALKERI